MSNMRQAWVLKQRPQGDIKDEDLELVQTPLGAPGPGEVLVRNLYLSMDPTNRIWMSDQDQYMPPVEIGAVMRGGGTVGVVEATGSDKFKVGDIVMPPSAWESHVMVPEAWLRPAASIPGVPLTAYLGVLGGAGITAYFGLLDIGQPKEGETVVVSAAAGAVGSVVGQIAKIKGCRVVGIAGGPDKCRWLTEELGFDGAVDYKNEDVGAALDRLCPNGIDVNFENVGGPIMEAVYQRLNTFARMPVCGLISGYNTDGPMAGFEDFRRILMRRILVKGFIVTDYLPRFGEAAQALAAWVVEGKIKYKSHVVDGLETAPQTVKRLFTGEHDGKLIIRVSPEP